MKQLWAPWRLEYVQHADEGDECVFCRAAGLPEDEPELVIHRGEVVSTDRIVDAESRLGGEV